ncbi:MAG: SAM-dependent methyltransferase [Ruminococcaceae bacterium]|nr:SAM-dependent methyltransferase [Oscillospiraceae bacterium]
MKKTELKNKRLQMIADSMTDCKKFADIGTDHAWLPIYMVSNGFSERAIACDIRKGPISVARKNISEYGLAGLIETRLGSGLSVLSTRDALDAVVIAGMGGMLIAEIIDCDKELAQSLPRMYLQPNTCEPELREYLFKNGYEIVDEQAQQDGRHTYLMIKCHYNPFPKQITNSPDDSVEKQIRFILGDIMPVRRNNRDKLYFAKLKTKTERILAGLDSSEKTNEERILRREVYERLAVRLDELMK